jgi:YjzC-like protein
MPNIGDRHKTGQQCVADGSYVFDGYTHDPPTPMPTQEERVISLARGHIFPPIRSTERGAYWRLQRLK